MKDYIRFYIVLLFAFSCGLSVSAQTQDVDVVIEDSVSVEEKDKRDVYDDMKAFSDALILVNKYYYEEKDYKELVQGAIDGLLRSLDPHSYYMNDDNYNEMKEQTEGKFSGIGIHVGMQHGMLTVIAPIEGSPAFTAGLEAGDLIIEIDGEKTQGQTLQEAIKRLKGPKGETVNVKIRRVDEDKPLDFSIVRDEIEVPTVKGSSMLDGEVGYIRISQFAKPTAEEFQKEFDELKKKGMKALVIDLRDNPGGLLNAAIEIGEKFLEKGKLIVTTKGRNGVSDIPRRAQGDQHDVDILLAVLLNKGSASASEIVAGALQDHKRAVIIGETSFGKGSVQSVIPMKSDEGAAIRMTTSLYYTPNDRQIHGKGIQPDIVVEVSPKEWRDARIRRAHIEYPELYKDKVDDVAKFADVVDLQLQRSVDLLKGLLVVQK